MKKEICATLYAHPEYDGIYATEDGKVFREFKKGLKEVIGCNNSNAYLVISVNYKKKYKHRIIYECVKNEIIPDEFEIDHINGNKTDNRIENLKVVTHQENMNNPHRLELVSKQVKCTDTGTLYPSAHEAARQLKLTQSNISACCRGKRRSCGGLHFAFA